VGDVADLVVGVGAVVGSGRGAGGGLGVGQAVKVIVGEGLCAVTHPGQLVRVKLAIVVDECIAPPRPGRGTSPPSVKREDRGGPEGGAAARLPFRFLKPVTDFKTQVKC
jgi:hypothetical protein